jgi:hypothetical protein
MQIWRVPTGISITVKPSERKRPKAILKNRDAPQKHARRAAIVLFRAGGLGTDKIKRRTKKSKSCIKTCTKTCIRRRQEPFLQQQGVEGRPIIA